MNITNTKLVGVVLAVVLSLMLVAGPTLAQGAEDPDNSTYTKVIEPIGNGWGITRITTTTADLGPDYDLCLPGGCAISDAVVGTNWTVYGGLLSYGFDGPNGQNDVVGFNFTFNPATPDTLRVWRNHLIERNASAVTDFGMGGVSQSGRISLRCDAYNSSYTGSGMGYADGTSTASTISLPNYNSTGCWTKAMGGPSCSENVSCPGIGMGDDVQAFGCFDDWVRGAEDTLTPTGSACGNVSCQDIVNGSHRGSVTVNSTAGKMAIFAKDYYPNSSQDTCAIRYIDYSVAGGNLSTTNSLKNFSSVITGKYAKAANYYGSSFFRNQPPVAMNDNGDCAVIVNVENAGTIPSDSSKDKAILFYDASANQWRVAVANWDTANHPTLWYESGAFGNAHTMSGCALDNEGNIYFEYLNWSGAWNGDSVTTNALFVAKANSSSNPTSWAVEPVIWRGNVWTDSTDSGGTTYEIGLMYRTDSGGINVSSASFQTAGINRTPVLAGADLGGLSMALGLGWSDGDPLTDESLQWNACYIAPTNQTPEVASVDQALAAADGTPVNLIDLVIIGQDLDYVPDPLEPGRAYAQYYCTDNTSPYSIIRVSTIRQELERGDVISVSGFMGSETSGERYLSSGGLVLTEKGAQVDVIYGMNNRSVGDSYGLSTVGAPWVKTWGVVSNLDSTAMTFEITDGAGDTILVDYSAAVIKNWLFFPPSNGDYVSVTGKVTAGGAATQINMMGGDEVVVY